MSVEIVSRLIRTNEELRKFDAQNKLKGLTIGSRKAYLERLSEVAKRYGSFKTMKIEDILEYLTENSRSTAQLTACAVRGIAKQLGRQDIIDALPKMNCDRQTL